MTIGKRVAESLDKFNANDAEAAFVPLCTAIDATSQKLYGTPGRKSYKDFIKENLSLITKVTFAGPRIENLNIAVPPEFQAKWPQMKVLDARGLCPVEDILYHVVRCGLLHEAELHPKLVFQPELKMEIKDEIRLPAKMILGLPIAVVACPANKDETMGDGYGFEISGYQIPFDGLWGKKDKLMRLYDAMDDFWKDDRDTRPKLPSAS